MTQKHKDRIPTEPSRVDFVLSVFKRVHVTIYLENFFIPHHDSKGFLVLQEPWARSQE